MRPTRVLLVDDTRDVRSLLKLSLGAEDGVEVVAEASNGIEAIVLADNHRPDVVVLDLSMPLMDGVEALPLIRRTAPETRVLVLSSLEARSTAAQVLERGAHAYLEKGEAVERISEGIRELAGGRNGGPHGGGPSTFQDSAERFREIFDHVELPVFILDYDARVLRVNWVLGEYICLYDSTMWGRAMT